MKVCFPVKEAHDGFESDVYGHFGSAPAFLVVDTATDILKVIENPDPEHAKGMCNPIGALSGQDIQGVVVTGIGGGALMKLNRAGITVYRAGGRTVKENLDLLAKGKLPEFLPGHVCGAHGHDCAHI